MSSANIDEVLATLQHRNNYYNDAPHDYEWTKREITDGDPGMLCVCGFHVRREWLEEAKQAMKNA